MRWPNDVVVADRKLAGVLVEVRDGRVVAASASTRTSTPPAAARRARAGHVAPDRDRAEPADRAQLLADLLWALEQRYDAFERDGFTGLEHDDLAGRWVTLAGGAEGQCTGVDATAGWSSPAGRTARPR